VSDDGQRIPSHLVSTPRVRERLATGAAPPTLDVN
jgi:hypothetical protein